MIGKICFGTHMETGAVVAPVGTAQALPWLEACPGSAGTLFTGRLEESDIVYGLGETTGGIDKRGRRFISFNTDNPHHRPDTVSLYGSHNFIVIDGAEKRGFFFDSPGRVVFDVGAEDPELLSVRCDEGVTVYFIDGPTAYDIVRQFLRAIGRSYLPPLWAFGFGQSRWGYKTERDIRGVVKGYVDNGLPLDYVCLDIDYMDRFIDFTVNKKRFPDLPALVSDLKEQGIRLVPIVDAGVKIEPGNHVFDEGLEKGYFCVDEAGKPFAAAVWPGMTHFPDFLRPEVREWFGGHYRFYTDQGLEGFWNDMNEPAIFYTEKRPNRLRPDPPDDADYQSGARMCDYKDFYHTVDGQRVNHHAVHNLFGANMTRAACEGLEKLMDRRFLLFSRSSYIGAHRYGGIWTGDNTSSWNNLRMEVRQLPSLSMCGFQFIGADTGGFGGNTTRELLLRWLALSAFTPLMRDHSALGTKLQECYRFKGREDFRRLLTLRYRLLPYLYSEFMKAALRYDMLFKPVAFGWPEDKTARRIEDQLLVGESIMIAPLLQKGKDIREVYLPEEMTQVTYRGGRFVTAPVSAGVRTVHAALDEVVFFIRRGKAMPVGGPCSNTSGLDLDSLTLLGDGPSYELYRDDGLTRAVGEENIVTLTR